MCHYRNILLILYMIFTVIQFVKAEHRSYSLPTFTIARQEIEPVVKELALINNCTSMEPTNNNSYLFSFTAYRPTDACNLQTSLRKEHLVEFLNSIVKNHHNSSTTTATERETITSATDNTGDTTTELHNSVAVVMADQEQLRKVQEGVGETDNVAVIVTSTVAALVVTVAMGYAIYYYVNSLRHGDEYYI